MGFIGILIQALVLSVCCAAGGRRLLHYFQLESYQLPGYVRSVKRNASRALLPPVAMAAVGVSALKLGAPAVVRLALVAAMAVVLYAQSRREKAKKGFVITERVKRLIAMHLATAFVLEAIFLALSLPLGYLLPAFEAALIALAALCAQPMEKRINRQFVDDAKKRLEAMPNLIRIGITGSYGKTSTKFLLRDILSVRYSVLATPSSFNTTMGVTRVIREQLTGNHQVFIAEMGARHVGDIRELVRLVHPKYGLLTSVGPQHLETFGTIQNIANTKYELIDGLPEDGVAFFADDAKLVHELYERCLVEKVLTGINGLGQELRAENLRVTINGSKFDLVTVDGRVKPCTTRLLGRHNISNIVLAASVALKLGLTLDEIGAGIRKIAPVEHRLQLIKGAMTVIDDAFNSNPSGAQEALNVLSGFPQNRIIITPGFVEQGEKEEELNYQFGAQMAGKVDVAILVGKKHSRPIHDGLTVAGFDEANIYVVPNLDEASVVLRQIGKAGDTVLFENDLPDNYNE